jgi:hypothetical protein
MTAKQTPHNSDESVEISELDRVKQRNKELERLVKVGQAEAVLQDRMVNVLEGCVTAITPKYSPNVIPTEYRKTDLHEFALLWSDIHAGEVVDPAAVNYMGEYDWTIMEKRHDELIRGILSYKENRPYPVNKLHLWGLGDMVSGEIHQELQTTNEFPIIEAAIRFGETGSRFIENLVPEFGAIHFAGVVGNHGRLYPKPSAKQKYNNFDFLAYNMMRLEMQKYKSISWDLPKSGKWPVELCGQRILLFHGDGVRSTMVGVPWGGITRYTDRLSNEWSRAGKPIDHFVSGHYHQANCVNGRRNILNGSMIGINEWALDTFGTGEPPCQVLLTFHPRHGLTDVSFIDLLTGEVKE